MKRAVLAVLIIVAFTYAADAQSLFSFLEPKATTQEDKKDKTDAERIAEARKKLEASGEALAKAREEVAAETGALESRLKELRAALDGLPAEGAEPERKALTAERDAVQERITLLRERLDAVDERGKALSDLIVALQGRESVRADKAAFDKEGVASKSAYTLRESELASGAAEAAQRALALAAAAVENANADLAANQAALEERKKAVERLKEERAKFDEAVKAEVAGADEAAAERINRRAAALNLRIKTAEDWVATLERQIRTAEIRLETAQISLDVAQTKASMERRRAEAIASRVVITPEQLEAEKQNLALAESSAATEKKRAKSDHDTDFRRLDRFTKEASALEKKLATTQDAVQLADIEARLETSKIRVEGAEYGIAAYNERVAAADLAVRLAEARVDHLETRLAAADPETGVDKLSSARRNQNDVVSQWKKRLDAARASLQQARDAASEAGAALGLLRDRIQLLSGKATLSPEERLLLPLLEDREDAMIGRRRNALYAADALNGKVERLTAIYEKHKATADFLDERLGAGAFKKALRAAGEAASDVWTRVWPFIKSVLILSGGLFLAGWIARQAAKPLASRGQVHLASMTRKIAFYIVAFFTITIALGVLEIQITTLLATAGILTVAIGFAAQNSVGNIISGVFLLIDRPFQIGEWVEVEGNSGFVVSIDLLSTKIRTFDNLLVRIPNETLVKSTITNFVAHPVRRYDVDVGVAYHEDVDRVLKVLREIAHNHRDVLEEPTPEARIKGFGDSSVDLRLRYWARREDGYRLESEIRGRIKKAFDEEGISIPFPQQVEWSGELMMRQIEARRAAKKAEAAPAEGGQG